MQMMNQQQANEQYVNAMLLGEAQPPNEYAADVVAEMQQARDELGKLKDAIEQGQMQLAQMQERRAQTIGAMQRLGQTLIKWRDKEAAAKAAEGETDE